MRKASEQSLTKLSADIVREAKLRAPVGVTGHYRRSINFSRPGNYTSRNRLSTMIGVEASADRSESAVVALVLETGRRAGAKMPPMSKGNEPFTGFELWVLRKLKPKPAPMKKPLRGGNTNSRTQTAKASKSAATFVSAYRARAAVRSVAFLVARKIKQRGLPARRIISTPFERISPYLPQEIKRRLIVGLNSIK